jgi:hypothetical protein
MISAIVNTYNWPEALRLSLLSLASQTGPRRWATKNNQGGL